MTLGLTLICLALLGWAVTHMATRPSGRDDDIRIRRVHRNVELVTLLDVENLMRAEGVPADTATRAMRRAEQRRITARTMWRWADEHGAGRLVVVLDAGLSEDTLLEHLDAGSTPEWHSIGVFADLANETTPAGMPLDELVDLDTVPALEDLMFPGLDDWTTHPDEELAGFDALPPVADPGFGPFSPDEALAEAAQARSAASATEPSVEDGPGPELDEADAATPAERKNQEDGGDWSAVA